MSNWINKDAMMAAIGAELHTELLLAAEPFIQKALDQAERAMRKRLAEFVVGSIENSYDASMLGDVLRIEVRLGKKP